MNAKRCLFSLLPLFLLMTASSPAKADDIDEKQTVLQNKINGAAASKKISGKDASELRKEMSDFDEKKRQTRAAHSDVLSDKDDKELDSRLSDISQHYKEKVKAKSAAGK